MGFFEYLRNNADHLIELTIEHIMLVSAAVGLAALIAIPLGIALHRIPALRSPVLNVASVSLTVPSLALFAILIPFVGIGYPPAVIALALYAQLAIIRNTLAGLQGLDRSIVESAKGMGLNPVQQLLRIELPLAWPVMLTGLRVATQLTIGIAAIAALVGGPGLGNEIFRGLRSLGNPLAPNLVWGGTLAIAVLAFVFDAAWQLIARLTTPRGIRG